MHNKHFMLFWLCLAYSVVLGHSIVPHHHHDEQEEMEHHEGDQHDDHHHGVADFFSYFAHGSHTNTPIYHFSDQHDVVSKSTTKPFILFVEIPLIFDFSEIISCSHHPPDLPFKLATLNFPDPRSPRAPPIC